MSRERRSLWLSVAGIAFMFFICPPTGIALGILRGRYEYKTAQGKRTGLCIAGGITMAVFFLLVYVQLFMNPDPPPYSEVLIIAGVLYFLPGLSMIRAGNRVIKRAEKRLQFGRRSGKHPGGKPNGELPSEPNNGKRSGTSSGTSSRNRPSKRTPSYGKSRRSF